MRMIVVIHQTFLFFELLLVRVIPRIVNAYRATDMTDRALKVKVRYSMIFVLTVSVLYSIIIWSIPATKYVT